MKCRVCALDDNGAPAFSRLQAATDEGRTDQLVFFAFDLLRQSVIRFRRGFDARSIPAVKFRIPDLMQVAGRVMEAVNSHNPDAVFVDGTGWLGRASTG